jgi:hypothetical protein
MPVGQKLIWHRQKAPAEGASLVYPGDALHVGLEVNKNILVPCLGGGV